LKKINFIVLIIIAYTFSSCALDTLADEEKYDVLNSKRQEQQVIKIISYGTKPTILDNSKLGRYSSIYATTEDEFTEEREFESSESIVLPELARYIYPGSLLMGNSIQNLDYKPISATLNPITVSLSIPAINKKTAIVIDKPSLSSTRAAVQNYLQTADFTQNGQLSYSIEQFSSYDELKVAFGSNVNTRKLFGKNTSSTSIEESMISKRTGFYVKFYQTSFTLDMDIPNPSLVANNNFDSGGVEPVYVSSISYGRMGVLTIETNETASDAKRIINETFNKLFYNKSTNFTQEEKAFINGSDYNLYLIGGDGVTASQAFQGYEAFVNHVSQGSFSKSQPGVPIFCSYSYLKDNSPVKTKFIFDIKKPPLYVELKIENIKNIGGNTMDVYQTGRTGNLKLYFYKSRSKDKTIANPRIPILIKAEKKVSGDPTYVYEGASNIFFTDQNSYPKTIEFTNILGDVYMNITKFYAPYSSNNLDILLNNNVSFYQGNTYYNTNEVYEYSLVPDPQNNYIIIK
jgi:thiol-activated cytolysin